VEKGGLSQALVAKGLKAGQVIVWADEMPAAQTAPLRQKLELKYVWRYLVLAGRLWWQSKESVFEVLEAPGHTAGLIRACGVPTVNLPPYSPQPNPVELRRQIEGKVCGQIERLLKALTADPSRVKRLTGWPA